MEKPDSNGLDSFPKMRSDAAPIIAIDGEAAYLEGV